MHHASMHILTAQELQPAVWDQIIGIRGGGGGVVRTLTTTSKAISCWHIYPPPTTNGGMLLNCPAPPRLHLLCYARFTVRFLSMQSAVRLSLRIMRWPRQVAQQVGPGLDKPKTPLYRVGTKYAPYDDWVHCEPIHDVDAEAGYGSGSGGTLTPVLRGERSETSEIGRRYHVLDAILNDVCYDENVWSDDDEGGGPSQITASSVKDAVLFTLTFGRVIEVYFAVVLSLVYRSPLDLNSVHKPTPGVFCPAENI